MTLGVSTMGISSVDFDERAHIACIGSKDIGRSQDDDGNMRRTRPSIDAIVSSKE